MSAAGVKKYILYGIGAEAEFFLYQNQDILRDISFCIDRSDVKKFYGLDVYHIENVDVRQLKETHYVIVAVRSEEVFAEIKSSLCGYGLKEWEHFTWSQAFRKKVVVINANCHGVAVKKYLWQSASFWNTYMIYPIPAVHLSEGIIDIDLLQHTDVYIHQDIRRENAISYQLSDEYVRQYLPNSVMDICIPNLVGMGAWMYPSLGGLEKIINQGKDPIYVLYRDHVLDEAARLCQTYEEIRKFWMDYEYEEARMESDFTACMTKLKERERNWDVKIYDYIMDNYRTVPCFTDASHPSKYVMKIVGQQIARIMGLTDIDDNGYESGLGLMIPVINCVVEHYHLDFQVPCEGRKEYLGRMVVSEIDDYIKAYLWWYHQKSL